VPLKKGKKIMMQNTLEKIEEMIRTNESLNENTKTELLNLLATLKPEMEKFSNDQAEHAESVAGFIERSTHEALRKQKNPKLLKLAIDGLSASVSGFESSHSQLVENVNYIASALANTGI
jgi:ABC-type transporter Mla subunit MlaD